MHAAARLASEANVRVSAFAPDWTREKPRRCLDAGHRALGHLRQYQRRKHTSDDGWWPRMRLSLHATLYSIWSMIAGMEISLACQIDGGLFIPHPNGIVIHPQATIGPNCLIFQQVTIGDGGSKSGVPCIGGHVDIGAGARLLGGIRVGNHAKIGANAVVLQDVPEYATAVGIPARIIPKV